MSKLPAVLSSHTHQAVQKNRFLNLVFPETEKADILVVGTGIQMRAFILVNKELSHSDSSIYLVSDRP